MNLVENLELFEKVFKVFLVDEKRFFFPWGSTSVVFLDEGKEVLKLKINCIRGSKILR